MSEDTKSIEEIKGSSQDGTALVSKLNGKTYYCKPCSLDEIPILIDSMRVVEQSLTGTAVTFGQPEVINAMKRIVHLGFKSIPESEVGSIFSLGDFPNIYKIVLDSNDFLAGMKTIYAQ